MSEETFPDALLAGLANEQFGLQGVAGGTISESGSRAALYLSTLSSGLVAIGFASGHATMLAALLFTVLPTIALLGVFTVVRLVDTTVQNIVVLHRMQQIRAYWASLHPRGPELLAIEPASSAPRGVHYGLASAVFTMATMIVVVNGVVIGALVAALVSMAAHAPLGHAITAGIGLGVSVVALGLSYQVRRLRPFLGRATSF